MGRERESKVDLGRRKEEGDEGKGTRGSYSFWKSKTMKPCMLGGC